VCLLYLPKRHDVRRRNFACRRAPSMCRTTAAGSFVDRSYRCEENQHCIQVFERKQTCRKQFRTLDGWTVGRAVDGARPSNGESTVQPGYRLSHIPIRYVAELDQLLFKCISITKYKLLFKIVFQILFSITFPVWNKNTKYKTHFRKVFEIQNTFKVIAL